MVVKVVVFWSQNSYADRMSTMQKEKLLSLLSLTSASAFAYTHQLPESSSKFILKSISPISSIQSTHPIKSFSISQHSSEVSNGSNIFAPIGDGYKTMASEFTAGALLQNIKSELIPHGSSFTVSFQDDLSETQLRDEMNLKVSGTVPVEGAVVSGSVDYARKAAKSNLSRTTTLVANATLGTLRLQKNKNQNYTVADSALRYFDENGSLSNENVGDFYKIYGESMVVSQELVSKVLITVKINFDSQSVLNEFTGEVGGSVANLITDDNGDGLDVNVSVKLHTLNEEVKKHASLTLLATQLGGTPKNLSNLFDTPSTCSLDKLGPCQRMIHKLNEYIKDDYKNQLDHNDVNAWYAEKITVEPYDALNLVTKSGKNLSLNNSLDPLNNIYLIDLVTRVNRMIKNEIFNFDVASQMLLSSHLGEDEKSQAINAYHTAEENYKKLKGFANYCYAGLDSCLENSADLLNTLVKPYDTNLMNPQLGTLVAKVVSNFKPLWDEEERSSENFLSPAPIFQSGRYSNYYFKVKSPDNTLTVQNNSDLKFDLACDIVWYHGYDKNIVTGTSPGHTILGSTIADNYKNRCTYNESLYIRNPYGFLMPEMVIELWGRE